MEPKMVINDEGLQEYRDISHQPQNPAIRVIAKVISYIFHPLFIPVYITAFLLSVQPYLFDSYTPAKKTIKLIQYAVIYSFFPLVTVLLTKALGFVSSIYLKTQKERIIPYIACGIYYFWACYVVRNQPENSKEVVQLAIAIFVASWGGLMMNIIMKISMHAISVGILLMFMGIMASSQGGNYSLYFSITILIAGLVCTSRLVVSDHTQREIYLGLVIGAVSMLAGVWIDGILP